MKESSVIESDNSNKDIKSSSLTKSNLSAASGSLTGSSKDQSYLTNSNTITNRTSKSISSGDESSSIAFPPIISAKNNNSGKNNKR
jgi:hypothetical protein